MNFKNQLELAFSTSNLSEFKFKEGIISGEECVLVCPQSQGVNWTRENMILRSCFYTKKDLQPVSLGFKKFWNVGEKPGLGEFNKDEKLTVVTKVDGCCIIVSKYKNELIIRTRETISAVIHETYPEIKNLVYNKYPKIVEYLDLLPDYSLIFENTSPNNKIVLNYDKPDLTLLGVIEHESYGYLGQGFVDRIAENLGVPRPGYHHFENFEDLYQKSKTEKSIEGWCIYYGGGQEIRKLKTDFYLACHRLKFGISKDKLIDIFLASGATDAESFKKKLAETYDYEVLTGLDFDPIIKAYDETVKIENRVRLTIEPLTNLNRKEQAGHVYRNLPKELVGYAFILLDNREFDDKIRKKIMREYV